MKLRGVEKQFWWHFGRITDSKNIPTEIPGYTSIDSENDDQELALLIDKIKIIHSIYLKDTETTDEGVKWIGQVQQLRHLTLMKHPNITKESLPYLNKLTDLEYLDIWRTKIGMEDLVALTNLKKLKELHVSPNREDADNPDAILEKVIEIESLFPGCEIYVDHRRY
jgi:hypothetical protein